MITLIEASNYRCLKYVNVGLEPFQVLVGPNASGKTTFLDVVAFLGQLVSEGLDYALRERTLDFRDLTWGREGKKFELAIEALIPETVHQQFPANGYKTIRYEIAIGMDNDSAIPIILAERVALQGGEKKNPTKESQQRSFFPEQREGAETISSKGQRGTKSVVNRSAEGKVNFKTEFSEKSGSGWINSFKLGARKSALGNLPEDESKYPVSTWLKMLLSDGVQPFVLNSLFIRRASPPSHAKGFKPDGSNLPWIIHRLREKDPARFRQWLAHLRTALGDIEDVRTIERADDRHRYLVIKYDSGLEVPSWMASDGTLRLMALTLPAYLSDFEGVYLIEEPENGIHPRAVESVFQSLSSVYGAQILLATHSPVVLATAKPQDVLCFAKTPAGITDIVRGDEHPNLRHWQRETNLGELFAAGVLG
jgi:predicted ATPase